MRSESLFGRYRDWVAAMVDAGESLAAIEQALVTVPLRQSSRDALWLLAWTMRGRHRANAPAPRSPGPRPDGAD